MSRAFRLGSVFSRVDGLIRKNLFPESDAPVWYEVYKRFPPKTNPTLKRVEPDIEIKEIFYKEDVLRARIHKEFENNLGAYNLMNNEESFSQKLLKTCQTYIAEGMSEDQAIEKLKRNFGAKDTIEESVNVKTDTATVN